MRKYSAISTALGLIAFSLAGCSAGNKSTSPKVDAQQEYQALRPAIDSMVIGVLDYLSTGTDYLEDFQPGGFSSPRLGRLAHDADTGLIFNYVYQNGWHIVEAMMELDSLSFAIAESLRFTDVLGTPQEEPDSATTTALRMITHLTFTSEFHIMNGTLGDHVDFNFIGFQSPTITADGTGRFGMELSGTDSVGAYSVDLSSALNVDHVTIGNPYQGGNGCPRAGTADLHLEGSFSGHDDEGTVVSGTANASVTVSFHLSGSADVTADVGGMQFSESVNACPSR